MANAGTVSPLRSISKRMPSPPSARSLPAQSRRAPSPARPGASSRRRSPSVFRRSPGSLRRSSQPWRQFLRRIDAGERIEPGQVFPGMRAVAHRQRRHACAQRHLQIVRRVAYHQRRFRFDRQLLHQFLQHGRMRLGMGFVGAARGIEILLQLRRLEHAVQADAGLARGHRQQMASFASARPAFRAFPGTIRCRDRAPDNDDDSAAPACRSRPAAIRARHRPGRLSAPGR